MQPLTVLFLTLGVIFAPMLGFMITEYRSRKGLTKNTAYVIEED